MTESHDPVLDSAPPAPRWTPTVGDRVIGVETQTIGQPTVTGYFHSSGQDGLSWLKIQADEPETAQRYLVGTATLKPYAPPAPRVFFPGDTVPAGVAGYNPLGVAQAQDKDWVTHMYLVELPVPSDEVWQSAVDRAREARANAEWAHTEGVNP